MAKHKRRKVCVICSAKWVIEYEDGEHTVEFITCPNHRYKKPKENVSTSIDK